MLLIATPPTFLQDSTVQAVFGIIVSASVAVVSFIITYFTWLRTKRHRTISYEIISDTPVVSIAKEMKDRVTLHIDGKLARDVSLLVLRVKNSGYMAVLPNDYLEPIMFKFEGREVLESDVQETQPENLADELFLTKIEPDAITLGRILLNPKDSITIKVLLAGSKGGVKARGRIVNAQLIAANK